METQSEPLSMQINRLLAAVKKLLKINHENTKVRKHEKTRLDEPEKIL